MKTIGDVIESKQNQKPMLDFLWRVILPVIGEYSDPTGVVKAYESKFLGGSASAAAGVESAKEVSDRVYEINTPFKSYKAEDGLYGATDTSSATKEELSTMTMVIDEYEDGLTLDYITAWMSRLSNRDTSRNPPAYYKREITFLRLGRSQEILSTTVYTGCWPMEINPINNSYEGNGLVQYSITFSTDDVFHI